MSAARAAVSAPAREFAPAKRGALTIGVVALGACIVAALLGSAPVFFRAYLVGYLLWLGVAAGSLGLLMLYHLVGGLWGYPIRRPLEAAAGTLPSLFLLFLPLLAGLHHLYPWTRPGALADELLRHKSVYLNVPFFTGRAVFYFAVWSLLAGLLRRWSAAEDRDGRPAASEKMRRLSGPGLAIYIVTMTFAGFDWVMSLHPLWWSTMLGMWMVVGQGLAALSFIILTECLLARRPGYAAEVTPKRVQDLGNLTLMFVMLWAYLSFSQFLIIWSGNLPEEIEWYLPRVRTSWVYVAGALLLLHFAVPFLLLLMRTVKRSASLLAGLAAALLVMRLVDLLWTVVPAFEPRGLRLHWIDLAAPVGLGGLWVALFLGRLGRRPLLAPHDVRLKAETDD